MEGNSLDMKKNVVELKYNITICQDKYEIFIDGERIYHTGDVFLIDDELYIMVRLNPHNKAYMCSLSSGNRWADEKFIPLFLKDDRSVYYTTYGDIDSYINNIARKFNEYDSWEYVGRLDVQVL